MSAVNSDMYITQHETTISAHKKFLVFLHTCQPIVEYCVLTKGRVKGGLFPPWF